MSHTHTHFSSVTPNALDVFYVFTNTFMNVSTHIHQHLISSCMRRKKSGVTWGWHCVKNPERKGYLFFVECWQCKRSSELVVFPNSQLELQGLCPFSSLTRKGRRQTSHVVANPSEDLDPELLKLFRVWYGESIKPLVPYIRRVVFVLVSAHH